MTFRAPTLVMETITNTQSFNKFALTPDVAKCREMFLRHRHQQCFVWLLLSVHPGVQESQWWANILF